jgi:hypothetical protein
MAISIQHPASSIQRPSLATLRRPINNARAMATSSKTPAPAALPLFRFRLRHLFAFFAVASALLTELVTAAGSSGLALVVITLVVMVHVTATALGSRLRECSPRASRQEIERGRSKLHANLEASRAGATSHSIWYGYDNSPLARLPSLILAGIALGGIGGVLFMSHLIGHRASLLGLMVGAISLAVLGGWFAFLGSSFCSMFRRGWQEAIDEQQQEESRAKLARTQRIASDAAR